jgi:N-acetylmuramoyl-L-alanine amidase
MIRAAAPNHPTRPLRNVTVVIDPGHPPGGAVGPTGLNESLLTLTLARIVRDKLRKRGASVVLTRDNNSPVDLRQRIRIAENVDADVMVSLHADAPPEGVDPYTIAGTRTFFLQPSAHRLASYVQQEIIRSLGLPDRGIAQRDLAILRSTWFPAILCEIGTLTIPEYEAGFKEDQILRAYAQAIVDGIERFFDGEAPEGWERSRSVHAY